jgi:hypothetical protein
MQRQLYPWEIKEAELLAKETAYLKEFNTFERIVDNHVYYCIALLISMPFALCIGLGIGFLL